MIWCAPVHLIHMCVLEKTLECGSINPVLVLVAFLRSFAMYYRRHGKSNENGAWSIVHNTHTLFKFKLWFVRILCHSCWFDWLRNKRVMVRLKMWVMRCTRWNFVFAVFCVVSYAINPTTRARGRIETQHTWYSNESSDPCASFVTTAESIGYETSELWPD